MDWAKFIDALEPQECILLGQTLSLKVNPKRGGPANPDTGLTDEEERLLPGYKIKTIKAVRTRTGAGLRDAKNLVDAAVVIMAHRTNSPGKLSVRIAAAIAEEYFEVPGLEEVSSLVDIIERVLTN